MTALACKAGAVLRHLFCAFLSVEIAAQFLLGFVSGGCVAPIDKPGCSCYHTALWVENLS